MGAKSFEDVQLAHFEKTIAINLVAPFNCIRHAFLQMKKQSPQGGRIINNGSVSAYTPRPGSAGYTASKHGISGLTKVSFSHFVYRSNCRLTVTRNKDGCSGWKKVQHLSLTDRHRQRSNGHGDCPKQSRWPRCSSSGWKHKSRSYF